MPTPRPFSRYEFMIAWRYLRARKAEGGVSTMTWISLIGIALGVMALITTFMTTPLLMRLYPEAARRAADLPVTAPA